VETLILCRDSVSVEKVCQADNDNRLLTKPKDGLSVPWSMRSLSCTLALYSFHIYMWNGLDKGVFRFELKYLCCSYSHLSLLSMQTDRLGGYPQLRQRRSVF
jgi:hypothetical protein